MTEFDDQSGKGEVVKFSIDFAYTKEEFVKIAQGLAAATDNPEMVVILLDMIAWAEGSTSDALIRFDIRESDGVVYPYRNHGELRVDKETGEISDPNEIDLDALLGDES